MEAARDAMVGRAGMPLGDLIADYAFVRLADLISLTFCTGWTDEQRFSDWTIRPTGTGVRVSPDAFGGKLIPIEITAKEIPDQPFRSDAELRSALSAAKLARLQGEVLSCSSSSDRPSHSRT